jgi:hypothetical protein
VYTAALAFVSRCKTPALMHRRPPICSTGPNPMQPTAVDEALIGETLRLSNARESWLGHSLLPAAQRGWPRTSSSSSLGKNTRGEEPMPRDSRSLQRSDTLLASRHVAQSRDTRIAAGLRTCTVCANGAYRQSRNILRRLRLQLSRDARTC